jgi:hypothetical protein
MAQTGATDILASYKQHTAVDDKTWVILGVEVTTGEKNEGEMIAPQMDDVKATTASILKP